MKSFVSVLLTTKEFSYEQMILMRHHRFMEKTMAIKTLPIRGAH